MAESEAVVSPRRRRSSPIPRPPSSPGRCPRRRRPTWLRRHRDRFPRTQTTKSARTLSQELPYAVADATSLLSFAQPLPLAADPAVSAPASASTSYPPPTSAVAAPPPILLPPPWRSLCWRLRHHGEGRAARLRWSPRSRRTPRRRSPRCLDLAPSGTTARRRRPLTRWWPKQKPRACLKFLAPAGSQSPSYSVCCFRSGGCRYAMDLNVDSAEDVLTHMHLLHKPTRPENQPAFSGLVDVKDVKPPMIPLRFRQPQPHADHHRITHHALRSALLFQRTQARPQPSPAPLPLPASSPPPSAPRNTTPKCRLEGDGCAAAAIDASAGGDGNSLPTTCADGSKRRRMWRSRCCARFSCRQRRALTSDGFELAPPQLALAAEPRPS